MARQSPPDRLVLSFGRFELSPNERLLTKDGAPIELGGRTLDTLIALASRPNEVMGKRALMAEVWPDVTVEEGSLRFHIAVLRKTLGDGKDGARYITTLAGRGYCFVAPVARSPTASGRAAGVNSVYGRASSLPALPAGMVGREESVCTIARELTACRFVTIVGPGGVGKTTVAVAVAHDLLATFDGAVLFVDFSVLSDPSMAPVSVASMLGLSVQSDDPTPSLIALLREQRVLLVFDNCEHVIDDAARLAEKLLLAAPQLAILATSREALRAEGEWVHRLAPLALPPKDSKLTAEAMLSFPAAQLFLARATANGVRVEIDDANAATIADICRKLDGMALAIQLAAGRVGAYGLRQISALLDERFTLLWIGQRTAPARQKTLQATFDWSYRLLSEADRVVFRRLAVFVGAFTIETALAVVTDEAIDAAWVFAAIDSLVAKSMVMAIPVGAMMRYRLLDAARAYALDIDADKLERSAVAARHSAYCLRWLDQFAADGRPLLDTARRASNLGELNNVRAALEWSFGDEGNVETGVKLATAAAPVFFAMSLLTECQRWAQRAIAALNGEQVGGRYEMRLQAALALSMMWTLGNSETTHLALNRSIEIAINLEDPLNQMMLIAPLHVFHMRLADFKTSEKYAEQIHCLSGMTDDPSAINLSKILRGYSFHFAGRLVSAREELEAALQNNPYLEWSSKQKSSLTATMMGDAMAAPILALASSAAPSALARTLWLQGRPTTALQYVDQTISDTASANHPVTRLVALMYAISVLIWNGDFDEADNQIAGFISNAKSYNLPSHILLGSCFEGQLAISRGDIENGINILQNSLRELRLLRYEFFTTSFVISLGQAFIAKRQFDQAAALIDAAIQSVETNGDFCYMPELLRVKASLLLSLPQPMDDLAEACLLKSIMESRNQGALAWELRTSIDLAKRLAVQGATERARALLVPLVDQFANEVETADLRTAKGLMAVWD